MTITYQESTVDTLHCERLEEGASEESPDTDHRSGLYKLVTPQAEAHEVDTVLQAHRKREPVTFTATPLRVQKDGYVYQIGRRGHWLETFIIVPEEYHEA